MTWRNAAVVFAIAVSVAGCAMTVTPVMPADEAYDYDVEPDVTPALSPLVESPPIEPVEPPIAEPAKPEPEAPSKVPRETPTVLPPVTVIVSPPQESGEDQQLLALLADLQRFSALAGDELRRELSTAAQGLNRQRTDINRVRLAVLYTLMRTTQDDQRALQLFENVAKNAVPSSSVRQLAAVLQTQVIERQRAVRDEQQKADSAIQKLEALRAMERSLLRDRVRSGGGGGSAGAGGSGR
ncbi:MAG: hypothetical protein ABI533_04510 [Betaproteobacteria bacterium]